MTACAMAHSQEDCPAVAGTSLRRWRRARTLAAWKERRGGTRHGGRARAGWDGKACADAGHMHQAVAMSAAQPATMVITVRMGVRLGALAGLAFAALFSASPLQADPTGVSDVNPIVGTWSRLTTCRQLVAVLEKASLDDAVLDSVSGNGFVPGVTQPDQIVDPADP